MNYLLLALLFVLICALGLIANVVLFPFAGVFITVPGGALVGRQAAHEFYRRHPW